MLASVRLRIRCKWLSIRVSFSRSLDSSMIRYCSIFSADLRSSSSLILYFWTRSRSSQTYPLTDASYLFISLMELLSLLIESFFSVNFLLNYCSRSSISVTNRCFYSSFSRMIASNCWVSSSILSFSCFSNSNCMFRFVSSNWPARLAISSLSRLICESC